MKNILLWSCLLASFNVSAINYINGEWRLPTERESCIEYSVDGQCIQYTALSIDEIAYHTMYNIDCNTKQLTGEETLIQQNNLTILFWPSFEFVECFVMTTTDTDGRTSKFSEPFYAVEWDAPKPVECVP